MKALSSDQVQKIFSGVITDWKDVGGKSGPIHLFTRDEASGTRAVFWKKALKKGPIAKGANVVPSNGAMKTAISQDPHAIGYVGIGYLEKSVHRRCSKWRHSDAATRAGEEIPGGETVVHEHERRSIRAHQSVHRIYTQS